MAQKMAGVLIYFNRGLFQWGLDSALIKNWLLFKFCCFQTVTNVIIIIYPPPSALFQDQPLFKSFKPIW